MAVSEFWRCIRPGCRPGVIEADSADFDPSDSGAQKYRSGIVDTQGEAYRELHGEHSRVVAEWSE